MSDPLDNLLPPFEEWATDLAAQHAQHRRAIWEHASAIILAAYPQVGIADSPENRAFARFYHAMGGNPSEAVGIAQLVFVYPPRGPVKSDALDDGKA